MVDGAINRRSVLGFFEGDQSPGTTNDDDDDDDDDDDTLDIII
jgi:hypothetical protein